LTECESASMNHHEFVSEVVGERGEVYITERY
jgi:hypothetical protein